MNKRIIQFTVKRLDTKEPNKIHSLEVDSDISFPDFKNKLMTSLGINADERVIKVRNNEGILIPLMTLLEPNSEISVTVEVTKIHQDVPAINCDSQMNSVYMDAMRSKLRSMESRISQAESMIPHLQWQRQSLVEHTANILGSRLAFLDRRIDELVPPQWNEKLQKCSS